MNDRYKFLNTKTFLSGILLCSIYVAIFLILEELALFNLGINLLIICGLSFISLIVSFIHVRNLRRQYLQPKPEPDVPIIEYDVYSDTLHDFNRFFFARKKNQRVFIMISIIAVLIGLSLVALFLKTDRVLTVEVFTFSTLVVLLIFYQMKKRNDLQNTENYKVILSKNYVIINGAQTIWNSDTRKVTDVVFRKINESTNYLTVYFEKHIKIKNENETTDFLRHSGGLADDRLILERHINIPVPSSQKENVLTIIDDLLKLKTKRLA